jgi:hypothetical protein
MTAEAEFGGRLVVLCGSSLREVDALDDSPLEAEIRDLMRSEETAGVAFAGFQSRINKTHD